MISTAVGPRPRPSSLGMRKSGTGHLVQRKSGTGNLVQRKSDTGPLVQRKSGTGCLVCRVPVPLLQKEKVELSAWDQYRKKESSFQDKVPCF